MTQQKSNVSYMLPLSMMFLLFFVVAFVTGLNAPIGPALKEQFKSLGLSENLIAQAGTFAFFASYGVMGIPSSWLVKKYGYKNTTFISLSIAILGSLIFLYVTSNPNFYLYILSTFIVGCSITILQVVVNPYISAMGPQETATSRLNFGGALNSLGATIAPIIGGVIIGNKVNVTLGDAKPIYITLIGLLIFVAAILYFVTLPQIHTTTNESGTAEKSSNSAWNFRHLLLGTLAIFFYVGVEVSVANTTYSYLTSGTDKATAGLGIAAATAGAIVGTYWFIMLLGRLLGGALGKKISGKKMLTYVSLGAIALLTTGILFGSNSTVSMPAINSSLSVITVEVPLQIMLFVAVGICASVMWPCIFNLAIAGLGKFTNQGSGMLVFMVIGGAIIPPLQGYIADTTGNFISSYWLPIIGYIYILFYALAGSKNVNTNIKVD